MLSTLVNKQLGDDDWCRSLHLAAREKWVPRGRHQNILEVASWEGTFPTRPRSLTYRVFCLSKNWKLQRVLLYFYWTCLVFGLRLKACHVLDFKVLVCYLSGAKIKHKINLVFLFISVDCIDLVLVYLYRCLCTFIVQFAFFVIRL